MWLHLLRNWNAASDPVNATVWRKGLVHLFKKKRFVCVCVCVGGGGGGGKYAETYVVAYGFSFQKLPEEEKNKSH